MRTFPGYFPGKENEGYFEPQNPDIPDFFTETVGTIMDKIQKFMEEYGWDVECRAGAGDGLCKEILELYGALLDDPNDSFARDAFDSKVKEYQQRDYRMDLDRKRIVYRDIAIQLEEVDGSWSSMMWTGTEYLSDPYTYNSRQKAEEAMKRRIDEWFTTHGANVD